MSEVKLNIRDAKRAIHNTIHGSCIDYIVAALSADPETIEELQAALLRFRPNANPYELFHNWPSGIDEEPYDAGIVFVDLTARLVAMESTYSQPGPRGEVEIGQRQSNRADYVPYHLADDWVFQSDVDCWGGTAARRRHERLALQRINTREVLYGGVCEFIVQSIISRSEMSTLPKDALYDAIKDIHAAWLTTPRDDLNNQAPRDVLLAGRSHLNWELEDRSQQWSIQGSCPPGLSKDSAAYRYGSFGTHEIVLYYDLVRFLLWNAQEHRLDANASAELIAAEVQRLNAMRDEWLATPDWGDLHGRTPASVIERERLRLPEGMTGAEAVIDHDCPTCQMMADMPGPMFWNLDGCNMDDEFAFSFHRTREEWEAEQREYEEFSRKFNEEQKARQADQPAVVWSRSYVNSEAIDESGSPTLMLMGLSMHLAELTEDLKEANAEQALIDVNRTFGNLREAVESPFGALLEPVSDKMTETLRDVADNYTHLEAKCADLQRSIEDLVERLTGRVEGEDLPF